MRKIITSVLLSITVTICFAGQPKSIDDLVSHITKALNKEKPEKISDLYIETDDYDFNEDQQQYIKDQRNGSTRQVQDMIGQLRSAEVEFDGVSAHDFSFKLQKDMGGPASGQLKINYLQGEHEFFVYLEILQIDGRWYISNSIEDVGTQQVICECFEESERYSSRLEAAQATDASDEDIQKIRDEFETIMMRCEEVASTMDQEKLQAMVRNCDGESTIQPAIRVRVQGDLSICSCADIMSRLLDGASEQELRSQFEEEMAYCEELFEKRRAEGTDSALFDEMDECLIQMGKEPLGLGQMGQKGEKPEEVEVEEAEEE